MRENLDALDALITKCAWLKDTTELVQILAAAFHSSFFEADTAFRAVLALHFCLQSQTEELLDGMEQLYKKLSVEERTRREEHPVSSPE